MPYIETIDQKTGKKSFLELSEADYAQLQSAAEQCKSVMTREALHKFIDNLNVSIEIKVLLIKLLDHAINFSGAVFFVGKKIIELLVYFAKKYPNMVGGMIVGAVLGAIFSSIPLLGWLLGSFVTPILILLGAGLGLWQDLRDQSLKNSIAVAIESTFGNFNKFAVP